MLPDPTDERTHIRRRLRSATGIVAAVLLATGTPAPVAVARTSAQPAVSGALLGAYVQPDGWSRSEVKAAIKALESDLGRPLGVSHLFYQWTGRFPTWKERWDLRRGRIPMISWRGASSADVVDGSSDARIRARARGLAELDGRVLLRWFPEMDGEPWEDEVGSPDRFVRAWRHIHDLFTQRGATNVEWVWCPTAWAFATGEAPRYYPGDAYVDWICADGYNWAPGREGATWTPFESIFSAFYDWASERGKPLMVGETGVLERDAGEKAAWITEMGATLKGEYPAIEALVYFDSESGSNQGGRFDWRLDTSPSAYEAFLALGADPYFDVHAAGSSGAAAVAASRIGPG